jgi:hypothetical protein
VEGADRRVEAGMQKSPFFLAKLFLNASVAAEKEAALRAAAISSGR